MLENLSNKSMEYDQRNNWPILGGSVWELIFKFPLFKKCKIWARLIL